MNFLLQCRSDLPVILFVILLFFSNSLLQSSAQLIPDDEVQTLRQISKELRIKYWNVSQTSCIDGGRTFNKNFTNSPLSISNVTCDCSFKNNNVCHVTNIQLKGLNLTGVIPPEFGSLSKLNELDLSRNYINGSIPTSLAKTPLVILSLVVNRISGTIPEEVGQITTLEALVLEDNQLGGQLPEILGNLRKLRILILSGNNFTGTIPTSFGKLKSLTDFWLDGSTLSGKLPSFMGNWTNLRTMYMQGTSMEGPIPSTISLLKNLTQLTISDLKGQSSGIPSQLQDLKKLQYLTLRNCLLNGTIPEYIGDMTNLSLLDLSFNSLTGAIPINFQKLNLNYMFLTNNSLNGSIPNWILSSNNKIDVSYNDFSGSVSTSCQQTTVNLVSSYSSKISNSNSWCLKKGLPCSGKAQYHSMFINCGGTEMTYDGKEYEEDSTAFGPSYFSSKNNWAYSSTGVFIGNRANYIASNTYNLNMTGPGYYQTARLAPISLKYYGICLKRGSYRVQLHFAEIMFPDDKTFSSVGERIFDVSIQGMKVLKDFNIAKEAGGAGKEITKAYNVEVNGSTLEIHLYWAGQGTTAVPNRGVYGPLISAITVTPNFKINHGLPVGVIIGVSISSLLILVMILVILWLKGCIGGAMNNECNEFQGLDTGYFNLRQIKAATDDFDPVNKIGEGGFGPVYKGVLPDGKVIAVKQLSSKSKQGNREFVTEIGMISALQHPNLVKLHGCCIEGKELLLVYEYMENNSLAQALFGREHQLLKLKWATRKNICLGIAKGLAYLHEGSILKIVHRDIKATNVLLDKDLNAKISDFGLARLDEEENSHISTRVAGTIGYMAPEYAMRGYLTDKADVYSFGVVVLEIVSGKSNTNYRPREELVYLLDWAYVLQEQGNLLELMDPSLGTHYSKDEAMRLLNLSLLCTNPSPTLRPSMSAVVGMIEGTILVQAPRVNLDGMRNNWTFKAFEISSSSVDSPQSRADDSVQSYAPVVLRSNSVSSEGTWVDSSVLSKRKVGVKTEDSSGSPDRLLVGDSGDEV